MSVDPIRQSSSVGAQAPSSAPRITIVTPSFNQERYLERTINSVIEQGYPNVEYMVIDGGSRDGSLEIIKRYESHLAYWVSEPDAGQADAINKGFRMATGDLIAWQNSDDVYMPNALWRLASAYASAARHAVYFGNVYLIDAHDRILREMRFQPFDVGHLMFYDWNLSSQAAFVTRDVLESVGYLQNTPVCFDWEWFIRLGKAGATFRFIREFLGAYRIHDEAKLNTIRARGDYKRGVLRQYGVEYSDEPSFRKGHACRRAYYRATKLFWHLTQGEWRYAARGVGAAVSKIRERDRRGGSVAS